TALKIAALREFGQAYGTAFQMQDDLLDMTSTEAALGKPVGNDLTEKKITIPLILALGGGDPEFRADVERFYAGDDTSPAQIAGVIAGIARQGGFEKTKALIAEYIERAKAALAPIGNAPARAEFVAVADALLVV
ncbi:MAG TPA: polyprenyl synthetase family protein, partial [Candidatus Lustribacter sp.]|nr:polyprenyl synthetase family protein [Candidatus Lustribacter sp.]